MSYPIESCLEGGALDADEIQRRLRGKSSLPEVEAVISMMEAHLMIHRNAAEDRRGTERDEACGAARAIREMRTQLLVYLASPDDTKS